MLEIGDAGAIHGKPHFALGKRICQSVGNRKPLFRKPDGWLDQAVEGHRAVMFESVDQAGDGAGDGRGGPAVAGFFPVDIAARIEEHIPACGRWRRFPVVDRGHLLPVRESDEHEAAAADIPGLRMCDSKRKARRNRGIDGVAAGFQNIGTHLRGDFFLRGDHAMFGDDGLKPGIEADKSICGRVVWALGKRSAAACRQAQGDDQGVEQAMSFRHEIHR